MASAPAKGRWVILVDDNIPPAFWSSDRKVLDGLCEHLRRTCPTARVVWQEAPQSSVSDCVPSNYEEEE